MIQDHIRKKILEKAISLEELGIRDLAWSKKDATFLIRSILNEDIGILGGDVYEVCSKKIIPLSDNWYCLPEEDETQKNYFTRSKIKSLDYIDNYPIRDDEHVLFSLVFNEEI